MKRTGKTCPRCGRQMFLKRGWKARGHELCGRCWRSLKDSARSESLQGRDDSPEMLVEALLELVARLGPLFREMEDSDSDPE